MKSIRQFLLFNLMLSIAVIAALTAIGSFLLSNHDVEVHLNQQLIQTSNLLTNLVDKTYQEKSLKGLPATALISFNKISDYQFKVWNQSGKLIFSSLNANGIQHATPGKLLDQSIKQTYWRTYTQKSDHSNLTITVAEKLSMRNQLDRNIAWDNVLILIFTLPLLGFLIWIIVGHALHSLNNIASAIRTRPATTFDPIELSNIPTEIAPLIEALNKMFLRLQETFEQNERFSGDAAHELRTPLAALKTQAQVALRATNEEERKDGLRKVILGANRCTHIVQQLLALSRFGPDTILNDKHHFELTKIATEVTAQLAPLALQKNIEIEFHETKEYLEIYGNETALGILIRNLIDNAIRYTPEKGEIHVYVEKQDNSILLTVADNGPGIPPELRSRVFERFYRVLGAKTPGSGLGLAIVQQIAELHNAKVELSDTSPDNGLKVTVMFRIEDY